MAKKALITVAVIAGVLALAFTYISARFVDHQRIIELQEELKGVQTQHASIYALAAANDSLKRIYQEQIASLQIEASSYRDQVRELETERRSAQFGVRRIRTSEALLEKFRTTFPQVKTTVRADSIYDSNNDLWISYLSVPLHFSETFIIEHQNAVSYAQQRDKLQSLDSLQTLTVALKDTVFRLEHEKAEAFRKGYDSVYTKYEALNAEYIDRLKNPEVNVGFPAWGTIVGSAAVGVLVGTQLEWAK